MIYREFVHAQVCAAPERKKVGLPSMGVESKPSGTAILRRPLFWLAPIAAVTLLMSVLAALYMGGMIDPRNSLHHFPIALVNQDVGDTLPGAAPGDRKNFGNEIAAGLIEGLDPEEFDLRQIGIAQAQSQLDSGDIYGAIVIPSDFTKRTSILAQASVVPGDVEQPVITVYTNPRAGTVGASIVEAVGDKALGSVNDTMGEQLVATVTERLATTSPDLQLSGASRLLLDNPVNVRTVEHNPLPDGTGFGLSAFYYALLIVLAGFTGAMVVNVLVDGMLGFAPTEFGPLYVHNESSGFSRFQTLLVKWLIMLVLGLIVSALYVWISTALGMPSPNSLALWEFGAFAITAVGVTAVSVMAAFGTTGLIINLLIFIVLGLPSSGGTIPIEATPRLFAWLAQFEPMHQIYLGLRSILYFGSPSDAGLIHAIWMTLLGMSIGLIFGTVTTRFYDRQGLHRSHRPKAEAA